MSAPRKHPPDNAISTIESLAAQGHSIIGIAKHLGVSRETFKKWCTESQELQEAFEDGREVQRQALIALIVQAAVLNKGANANAMFLLKTMFGFREFDSPHTKVDVAIAVAPVMVVRDFGTDAQWAATAAAQQKALMTGCTTPPQLEASQSAHVGAVASVAPPSFFPPIYGPQAAPVPTAPPQAPVWRGRA